MVMSINKVKKKKKNKLKLLVDTKAQLCLTVFAASVKVLCQKLH